MLPKPQVSWSGWPTGELIGEGSIAEVDVAGAAPPLLGLHGFGATPNEVLMLIELAAELGLRRRAPTLPGHGTHARDLARTTYADWYGAAERELVHLSADGPVVVGGQSMGSVLALDLAARHPKRVRALIVLANATRLASYPALPLKALGKLHLPNIFMPKFGGPNIRDPETRGAHPTYGTQPTVAALEVQRAGADVLGRLCRVRCPTFIAHGVHDRVCPVQNAWRVAEALGTPDVELVLLQNSAHIVTKDADRQLLEGRLRGFLRRVTR